MTVPNNIINVYDSPKFIEKSHGGIGSLSKIRPFSTDNFKTSIDFIDYVIISPGSTIGEHKHGENEEVYFIVKGNGVMTINSVQFNVTAGDVILNSFGDTHGLVNSTDINMEVFIFQVK